MQINVDIVCPFLVCSNLYKLLIYGYGVITIGVDVSTGYGFSVAAGVSVGVSIGSGVSLASHGVIVGALVGFVCGHPTQ